MAAMGQRRVVFGFLLGAWALLAGWQAPAGPARAPACKEDKRVVGFSQDGARFGLVLMEPGGEEGALKIWDVGESKLVESVPVESVSPGAELLTKHGFGQDEGEERYTSGTSTATRFTLGPSPVAFRVELATEARARDKVQGAEVVLSRGGCKVVRKVAGVGSKYNLVAVRASAGGKSLAVVVKRTVDGCRRHAVVTAPIVSGELAQPACLEDRCFARLRELAGHWYGDQKTTDFEGGDSLSEFNINILPQGPGQFEVHFGVEPAVGAVMMDTVTRCSLNGGDVELTVGEEGAAEGGSLSLHRLGPNRMDVSAEVPDWNAPDSGNSTSVEDRFSRSR